MERGAAHRGHRDLGRLAPVLGSASGRGGGERRKRGREALFAEADVTPPDPVADESLALAGISSAVDPGARRSGTPRGRARVAPGGAPSVLSSAPRHAHIDGLEASAKEYTWAHDGQVADVHVLGHVLCRPAAGAL